MLFGHYVCPPSPDKITRSIYTIIVSNGMEGMKVRNMLHPMYGYFGIFVISFNGSVRES